MNLEFKVKIELPEDCSVEILRKYIEESIQSMKGCKHPDDPLYYLDRNKVKVTRLKKITNKPILRKD